MFGTLPHGDAASARGTGGPRRGACGPRPGGRGGPRRAHLRCVLAAGPRRSCSRARGGEGAGVVARELQPERGRARPRRSWCGACGRCGAAAGARESWRPALPAPRPARPRPRSRSLLCGLEAPPRRTGEAGPGPGRAAPRTGGSSGGRWTCAQPARLAAASRPRPGPVRARSYLPPACLRRLWPQFVSAYSSGSTRELHINTHVKATYVLARSSQGRCTPTAQTRRQHC
jgi:hypothetical protein